MLLAWSTTGDGGCGLYHTSDPYIVINGASILQWYRSGSSLALMSIIHVIPPQWRVYRRGPHQGNVFDIHFGKFDGHMWDARALTRRCLTQEQQLGLRFLTGSSVSVRPWFLFTIVSRLRRPAAAIRSEVSAGGADFIRTEVVGNSKPD